MFLHPNSQTEMYSNKKRDVFVSKREGDLIIFDMLCFNPLAHLYILFGKVSVSSSQLYWSTCEIASFPVRESKSSLSSFQELLPRIGLRVVWQLMLDSAMTGVP